MLSLNSQLQEKRSRFHRRLTENFEGVKITTALQTFDKLTFAEFVAEYFAKYKQACNDLSSQITATDNEIDLRVYHLYGLTYDEVLIVDPNTTITKEEYESNK